MTCQTTAPAALRLGEAYLKEGNVRLLPKTRRRKAQLLVEVIRMRAILNAKSNELIMRKPVMTDPDHLASMQIMNMSIYHAHLIDSETTVFLAIRMLQMTLKHGLSSFSCVCFGYWATVLSAMHQLDEANRFADLALRLVEKFQSMEWLPRVYAAVYGFAKPWKSTYASALEPLQHSFHSGLEQGDIVVRDTD